MILGRFLYFAKRENVETEIYITSCTDKYVGSLKNTCIYEGTACRVAATSYLLLYNEVFVLEMCNSFANEYRNMKEKRRDGSG
jgi:hypothetical protein